MSATSTLAGFVFVLSPNSPGAFCEAMGDGNEESSALDSSASNAPRIAAAFLRVLASLLDEPIDGGRDVIVPLILSRVSR
jgi:hypothetical protein